MLVRLDVLSKGGHGDGSRFGQGLQQNGQEQENFENGGDPGGRVGKAATASCHRQ